MNSAQIEDFENEDDIILGKFNIVRGRLHLINPQKILINDSIAYPEDVVKEITRIKGTTVDKVSHYVKKKHGRNRPFPLPKVHTHAIELNFRKNNYFELQKYCSQLMLVK